MEDSTGVYLYGAPAGHDNESITPPAGGDGDETKTGTVASQNKDGNVTVDKITISQKTTNKIITQSLTAFRATISKKDGNVNVSSYQKITQTKVGTSQTNRNVGAGGETSFSEKTSFKTTETISKDISKEEFQAAVGDGTATTVNNIASEIGKSANYVLDQANKQNGVNVGNILDYTGKSITVSTTWYAAYSPEPFSKTVAAGIATTGVGISIASKNFSNTYIGGGNAYTVEPFR